MTIKATSVLSLAAVWAAMIPAVAIQPQAWWALIFAFLASGCIGIGAWRRLGLSRVIAIAGTWGATGMAIATTSGAAWISVFAFLSTCVVTYSTMRRGALGLGAGIASAWAITGFAVAFDDDSASLISVFAFLTAAVLANSGSMHARGVIAAFWWGIVGAVMVALGGWYWLSVFAFILSATAIGFGGEFRLPRGLEWDLFDRDDDGETVR